MSLIVDSVPAADRCFSRLDQPMMTPKKKTQQKSKQEPRRTVLIILSNRWNRNQKPRFLELDCDAQGNIHQQRPLRSQPREPRYDEVWENDEGKTEFASCHRFQRQYSHKLQKRSK
jgi:hypothetical protein